MFGQFALVLTCFVILFIQFYNTYYIYFNIIYNNPKDFVNFVYSDEKCK